MVDNSNKKGSSNKTIRLDKKVFCLMMIVTPIFAAYLSVLTFMAVFQPWNSAPLEVPVLGGTIDQDEEQEEDVSEEAPAEEAKEEQPAPAEEAPKEEQKVSATIIKSINYIQNKTQEQKQPIEIKKEESKPAEEIAREVCEARTDGPARLIEVRFLLDWEKTMYSNFGMENPVVDYTERVAPNGHTKMAYVNGACVPSKDGLIVDDEKNLILEESQLAEFGIAVRSNYETWV